jgi:CheY-like chemotaxis protein
MWDQVDNLQVILVVEGDHLIQSIVEESLTDGGFEIVIASSGQNALELLDASEGKYRALVTDINLVGRFLGSNRMLAGTEVVKCPCEMRAWSLSTKVLL